MQVAELALLLSSNPPIPRTTTLECSRLPSRQSNPLPLVPRHVAKTSPRKLSEAKIVALVHKRVPLANFVGTRAPYGNFPRIELRTTGLCGWQYKTHGYLYVSIRGKKPVIFLTHCKSLKKSLTLFSVGLSWAGGACAVDYMNYG